MANLLLPSDISWLTIKHHSVEDVLKTLQLLEPAPLHWNTGVCTILSDYWDQRQTPDSALTRVYVSSPIDGWIFVFGEGVFVQDLDQPILGNKERREVIRTFCQNVSKLYGSVGYFTCQPREDRFEWMLVDNGTVKRHFEWNDGALNVQGAPIFEKEVTLIEQASAGESVFWEDVVYEVLEQVSINPEIVLQNIDKGFLCATPYGTKVGLPPQPILDL